MSQFTEHKTADSSVGEANEQISVLTAEIARMLEEQDLIIKRGDEQTQAAEDRALRYAKERDTLKRHLDAIAEALGLDKTYLPDQLPEMVTALRQKKEQGTEHKTVLPKVTSGELREYAKTIERLPAGSKKQADHYIATARGLRKLAEALDAGIKE